MAKTEGGGHSILGAKLFGITALAIAAITLVPGTLTKRMFDFTVGFPVHMTYIVVAGRHAILGFALLCGIFAGFYYFADRAIGGRLSVVLSLAHLLLWIFALVAFLTEELALVHIVRSAQDPTQSQLVLVGYAAAVMGFVFGGLLFVINLVWGIARRLRTS